MKKDKSTETDSEMLPEYDFQGGVRGKYVDRFGSDTHLILLEPDVARSFPDGKSVNEALRALLRLQKTLRHLGDSLEGGSET